MDFSDVSVAVMDESVLKILADRRSLFDSDAPHVIITPADLGHELATKYRSLALRTRPNLHLVRSMAEARELLASLGCHSDMGGEELVYDRMRRSTTGAAVIQPHRIGI